MSQLDMQLKRYSVKVCMSACMNMASPEDHHAGEMLDDLSCVAMLDTYSKLNMPIKVRQLKGVFLKMSQSKL